MNKRPNSSSEKERLDALKRYHILDTVEEKDFNDIVELASFICKTPISLISLIDENRQWFKAKKGLDIEETSRNVAFCDYAIKENKLFEVVDTSEDQRFAENPLVTGHPNIRSYAGYPLTTKDGYNLGTLCVIDKKPKKLTDEQKKALEVLSKRVVNELELRYKIKQLNKVSDFKDKILSILGHDIRSPLSSINSVIEMIDQDLLSEEELDRFRKLLKEEVTSTLNLLDNVLNWATLYMEGRQNTFESFRIENVIRDTIQLLKLYAAKKDLNTYISVDQERVYGDPEMIKLIIRNIYSNAIKFTIPGGAINIHVAEEDDHIIITITDTGIGMKQEQIDRILKRKGGVSALGTSNERGSGIGMLLTLEFVEANNGKLTIESEFEKGSNFILKLPKG